MKSKAAEDVSAAWSSFDDALFARIKQSSVQFRTAISGGAISDPISLLAHNVKLAPVILKKVIEHLCPPQYNPRLDVVYEAQFGYQLSGDTFFSQFRVLHQVPELLAREALRNIQILAKGSRTSSEAVSSLISQLNLIGDAIAPLATCLSAAEYHKIRHYLGQTSGSDSETLRADLFGSALDEFEAFAKDVDTEETHSLLHFYRLSAHRWRSLHLTLPRSVLGANTRSLIGSNDAISAAASMQSGAERKHAPAIDEGFWFSEKSSDALVEMTGSITRDQFRIVQSRPSRTKK
jgi:tryptophan 2,3-dioxygenase